MSRASRIRAPLGTPQGAMYASSSSSVLLGVVGTFSREGPVKILFVSQYFPPEMGAPAARVHELSTEWVKLGHEVTVLTGFPNHPTGVIPPEYRGQLVGKETVNGIKVIRTPIYAAANQGFFKRVLNYLSFSISASLIGPWLLDEQPDVIIGTSPQMLTAVAAYWLAKLKRVPFIFEVRDLWPRSIVEVGAMRADSPAIRALEQLEHFLYRQADHIVVVTHSFVDEIAAHGIARDKISVITNGVDLELFQPRDRAEARQKLGLDPKTFYASYIGTHGMAHGLDTALDAAKLVTSDGIEILLVGEGAEKARLKARAQAEHIDNVRFMDQMPRDQVAQIIAASNTCLVLLRDLPLFRTVIPSKIFEYMGAARAILTTVDGESRAIVEGSGAGRFVPPENAAALAAALRDLRDRAGHTQALGNAGRKHAVEKYSRFALARRFSEVLSTFAGK
jgi:colanic acid biosynthesis glycosyl transferase WcaI